MSLADPPSKRSISVDTWAVIIALLAVLLVGVGVVQVVPW